MPLQKQDIKDTSPAASPTQAGSTIQDFLIFLHLLAHSAAEAYQKQGSSRVPEFRRPRCTPANLARVGKKSPLPAHCPFPSGTGQVTSPISAPRWCQPRAMDALASAATESDLEDKQVRHRAFTNPSSSPVSRVSHPQRDKQEWPSILLAALTNSQPQPGTSGALVFLVSY